MEAAPLFSVLVANYNNGRYLQQAIESVLAQTYSNWELIIVDDGSTDNSNEIYDHFQSDNRIHVYHNEKNKGCGYTKRLCVEKANGEICGFLDADDVLLPDALHIHISAHQKNPDCSCVFSRYYHCDEHLENRVPLRALEIPEGEDYFTHRDYMPEHLTSFKRYMYLQTAGIDSRLAAAVDQDLYLKLEEVAPIVVSNNFTYLYRSTSNQISYNYPSRTIFWNCVVRYETCCRRGLDPERYAGYDLMEIINNYETTINALKQDAINARKSKAYRLGRAVSNIFRPFKK